MQKVNHDSRLIAFLTALCLFLSAIEYIIPKPLPFMRLGLANMPIILSLYLITPRQVLTLAIFKVFGQGLITGTLFSYIIIFSISGTVLSACCMLVVWRLGKDYISCVGISIIGALANALSQTVLSEFILFEGSAYVVAPILLINAVISGGILGLFTNRFVAKSTWFKFVQSAQSSWETQKAQTMKIIRGADND